MDRYIKNLNLNEGVQISALEELEATLNADLPTDYKLFMLMSNGASGFVGESYVLIFEIEMVKTILEVTKELDPRFLIFGSDGGGGVYAFNLKERFSIILTESVDLGISGTEVCGPTFMDFLSYLHNKKDEE